MMFGCESLFNKTASLYKVLSTYRSLIADVSITFNATFEKRGETLFHLSLFYEKKRKLKP